MEPFRILVVCGAPHVGKSTVIASLVDAVGEEKIIDIIDMLQFQGNMARRLMDNAVVETSVSNALVDACVINTLIDASSKPIEELSGLYLIIEGTYMMSARRASLRQSIKTGQAGYSNLGIDIEVIGIQVKGSEEMLHEHCPLSKKQIDESEPMTLDEGYDSLVVLTNAPEDGERYIKVSGRYEDFMVVDYHEPSDEAKRFVNGQKYDRIMRDDLLGYRKLMDED